MVFMILRPALLALMLMTSTGPALAVDEAGTQSRLDKEIAQLNIEVTQLLPRIDSRHLPEDGRQMAIQFRGDERTLKTLARLSNLADRLLATRDDTPERAQFTTMLTDTQISLDTLFRDRLLSLQQRLDTQLLIVDAASGLAKVEANALASSLGEQRLRYLDAMIDQVQIRAKMNVPSENLSQLAAQSLTDHGEGLLGALELGRSARNVIAAQLPSAPDNADLKLALQNQEQQLSLTARHLEQVVAQLNRLGIDTTDFRKALLRQTDSLTVTSVDADLVSTLLRELRDTILLWLKTSAFDLMLEVMLFIAIVLLARWLSNFAQGAAARAMTSKSGRMNLLLRDVSVSLIGGTVLFVGVLIAFSQVGISLAPMLAGLGVAGFIIGFALQDTLGNFAAGTMILAYRPFNMGDYIEVAGIEGAVKHMTLVSTTIATVDNKTLIVPNSKIWGDVIRNYTGQRIRRVDLEFGVSYNDKIEHVERVLHEVLAQEPLLLTTPESVVHLHRLSDSSMDFVVRPWVRTEDYWEAYWALMRATKLRFDAEGISIPFPQRDVHWVGSSNKGEQLS